MSNSKWYSYNWIIQNATDFVITSGNEDAFFPISNLKLDHSTKVYRSQEGTTNIIFYVDIKTFAPIDSIMVVGHALEGIKVNSINVKASGTTDFSTPLFSYDLDINNSHNIATKFFSETSARYFQFTLGTTENYIELSNIFIGKKTTLASNNVGFGWTFENIDLSSLKFNRYKNAFIDQLNDLKRLVLSYKLLNQAEFKTLNDMFAYHGITVPVWFILDPNELIYSDLELFAGQFRFKSRPKITNIAFALYDAEIKIEQVI